MLEENKTRRLTFIRYMHDLAVEQSRQSEPMNAVALLTFHDAIELFLQLAAEHLDVSKSGPKFMEYWELIKPKLSGDGLKHKEAMRRLNDARGALKHRGNRPARDDVEAYRATARLFFEDNTPLVFGIDFADVTLIDYVRDSGARRDLAEAEDLFRQGRKVEALGKVAVAFARITDSYKKATGMGVARSQLPRFRTSRTSYSLGGIGSKVQDPTVKRILGELIEQVQAINKDFPAIAEATDVAGLGLDHRRYSVFKRLTPTIRWTNEGGYEVQPNWPSIEADNVTEDLYQFCLDFVVENAMRLQEFATSGVPDLRQWGMARHVGGRITEAGRRQMLGQLDQE